MKKIEAQRLVNSLYVPYYSNLVRYAARVGGSLEIAEDVVQEAFIKLFRALLEDRKIDSPRAWLLCVVRRGVSHECQRESRQRGRLTEMARSSGEPASAPASQGLDLERRDELDHLLAGLTGRETDVLFQRMQALKYKEIASNLGIGTNTVKTLLARALRKMRNAAVQGPDRLTSHDELDEQIPPTLQ